MSMAFKAEAKAKVNIPLPLDALKGALSQVRGPPHPPQELAFNF